MKLINNWKNAHKALSVVLPTIGSLIFLIITILHNTKEAHLIPSDYVPYLDAIIIPVLAWIGRIISQPHVALNDKPDVGGTQ